MKIELIDEIANRQKIKRKDLIEKDVILHQILTDLSKDKFFSKNFVFKGGTCLVKSYLGYFRFSEDIDFTWKDQSIFNNKSVNKISEMCSNTTDKIGIILEEISKKRNLNFKYEKGNKDCVVFGGSNRMCTLFIPYSSVILKMDSFLKVQINFVENLCLNHCKNELKSLMPNHDKEFEFLFPEIKEYSSAINFQTYDIKEILSEKIRAILTRMAIKARDFVDVYLICKKFDIKLEEMEKCIVEKTKFGLNLYKKYNDNLEKNKKLIDKEDFFEWGEEKGLLIEKIDDQELNEFIKELKEFLKKIIKKL